MILRLEREIRTLAAAGESGHLSELWDKVAARWEEADAAFGKSARIARAALETDGAVLDCRPDMATGFIAHVWSAVQEQKAQKFRATAGRLAVRLADILRADYLRSSAGRSAESLAASVGPAHQALFDFAAMSKLLPKSSRREALSESRRRRIELALAVLKRQRFFAPAAGQARPDRSAKPYSFRFDNCAEAISAYRARLPDLAALVKAMSIAELESEGAYVEAKHDVIFSGFDAGSLNPRDCALFPDYLVVVDGRASALDTAALMAALSSDVPLKILLNVADLFEETTPGDGRGAAALRSAQLASSGKRAGRGFRPAIGELESLSAARPRRARARLRRAGAVLGVFGRAGTREFVAALSERRRGDAVAGVSGVQLRSVRRRRFGVAVLAGK